MGQNLIEQIVQRHAEGLHPGQCIRAGDFVTVRPAHVMTHDNTAAVMLKFEAIGATRVADPSQPVFALDHNVQDRSEKNQARYEAIEEFARRHGICFHPAGRGIGHQVMVEEGFVLPGTLVVASDSHSNLYGGLGALGTPVVRTDAAALWATGRTWWQVPPVTRVIFEGALRPPATGKDVILALCGYFCHDEVLNHALEFHGAGVASLSIEQRLTIANMTTEWGALAGLFPCDGRTVAWLRERRERLLARGADGAASRLSEETLRALEEEPLAEDRDAAYAQELILDLDSVVPLVCGPNSVKTVQPAAALAPKRIPVHKAYLLSCVNGRLEDLAEAAKIVAGRNVAPGVQFWMAAASSEVEEEARRRGYWQTLVAAGARPLPAGCGPCIGLGEGLLEDGENGISATNRNFQGRMGSREASAWLASPAVVAASALAGHICGPASAAAPEGSKELLRGRIRELGKGEDAGGEVELLAGFPESLEGELLFCDADNLNTDGIYPGAYTYREDLTPDQMAAVAMENYDPAFQGLASRDDILVGGYNFGTGSSREQAATALLHRGIPLVLAGSFSATYKRNAFNNGAPLAECPALVDWLRERFPEHLPTRRTGIRARVDFRRSRVEILDGPGAGRRFAFPPLGRAAQELVIAGGLESLVRGRLLESGPV